MLRATWTSGGAAAPDTDAYRGAIDKLTVSFGNSTAIGLFPRDPAMTPTGLDQLAGPLREWLAARALPDAPAKLMLHGYDYDPRHADDPAFDPFATIYSYPGSGVDQRLSWLPLVKECGADGSQRQETAIAFAWVSTGLLSEYARAGWSENYEYACVDLAPLAANALAALLRVIAAENVQVDILAHSLGTRLFTKAVAALGADDGMINNVILLDGAEFSVDAAATFAGRNFNVVNVINQTDTVLSTGAQHFGDPSRAPGSVPCCSLGRFGLGSRDAWTDKALYPPNWVDIPLNRADVQAWFWINGGYSLTAAASDDVHANGHWNHWACYTEPGNRVWLTDLLWKPGLNGSALAKLADLPTGVLGEQPVFAGLGIPDTTPMTSAARMAYQQRGSGAGVDVG